MFYSEIWLHSSRPKFSKICILMLLLLLSLLSVQTRSFNHEIEVRSPDIDPYWYVGRGVRPIGRFGKRYLKNMSILQPQLTSISELILNQLKKQERHELAKIHKAEEW